MANRAKDQLDWGGIWSCNHDTAGLDRLQTELDWGIGFIGTNCADFVPIHGADY